MKHKHLSILGIATLGVLIGVWGVTSNHPAQPPVDLLAGGGSSSSQEGISSTSSSSSQPRSEAFMKTAGCVVTDGVPDQACTPGYRDPNVTDANIDQTICVSGYSKTVRPPASLTSIIKQQVAQMYGLDASPATMRNYEGDHALSIEDGGCPGPSACGNNFTKNFWDEAYCTAGASCPANDPRAAQDALGAKAKDQVENLIHKELCAHQITLDRAAYFLPLHWTECLADIHQGKQCL